MKKTIFVSILIFAVCISAGCQKMRAETFLEQTNDDDLCYLLTIAGSVWLGTPADKYTGFNSPSEIKTDGLLNFFFVSASEDEYYNEDTKMYIISDKKMNAHLSRYFENYNLIPEEAEFFSDIYNSSKKQYESRAFLAFGGPSTTELTGKIINKDGTITIYGNILFEEKIKSNVELTIKIVNGNTMLQKYSITHI